MRYGVAWLARKRTAVPAFFTKSDGRSGEAAKPAPAKIRFLLLDDQGRSNPAGGQFSSFIPNDNPREASTSLISLGDLRARFGVFSSSVSVRWIRSPM